MEDDGLRRIGLKMKMFLACTACAARAGFCLGAARPAQLIKGSFVFSHFDLLNGGNSKGSQNHELGQQKGDFWSILGFDFIIFFHIYLRS